jgi:hypothetical protein
MYAMYAMYAWCGVLLVVCIGGIFVVCIGGIFVVCIGVHIYAAVLLKFDFF